MIHDPEPAPTELPRLWRPGGPGRRTAFEPVRQALGPASGFLQKPAGHVQRGLHDQVASLIVQSAKIHEFRVAQQPGRLVVEGVVPLIQLADPQGDRQGSAL